LSQKLYLSHVGGKPYEAFQAQAKLHHTWFSWYSDDFNLDAAANAAVQQDVAIVFFAVPAYAATQATVEE